jgi:hypothetical protein
LYGHGAGPLDFIFMVICLAIFGAIALLKRWGVPKERIKEWMTQWIGVPAFIGCLLFPLIILVLHLLGVIHL